VPTALAAVTAGKTLYGLPTVNYTQGLIINRVLFKQAGLNPDKPPTTWAEVEQDAKAITKLGHGIFGYGDYSAGNNGGWHFSSEVFAEGGQMINSAGTAAPSTPIRAGRAAGAAPDALRRPQHEPDSSSPGARCRSRWPRTSSACTSPPPTTSTT
jgi:ABC-type sugar transport system, periplasmic component